MNTKKMIQSIMLLGLFWYSYLVYICIFELHLNLILLILLTMLTAIFIKCLYPLLSCSHNKQRKVDDHGV